MDLTYSVRARLIQTANWITCDSLWATLHIQLHTIFLHSFIDKASVVFLPGELGWCNCGTGSHWKRQTRHQCQQVNLYLFTTYKELFSVSKSELELKYLFCSYYPTQCTIASIFMNVDELSVFFFPQTCLCQCLCWLHPKQISREGLWGGQERLLHGLWCGLGGALPASRTDGADGGERGIWLEEIQTGW